MARRPERIPRWGHSAGAGVLVEPPSGEAAAGWITGQRPPAQYLNWLFNLYGAWTSFFSGPSVSDWTRRDLPDPSTDRASVAFDDTTEDNTEARYRYALVGSDGTGAFVAVSRTGIDWITRRNIGGTPGNPQGVVPPSSSGGSDDYFWLWTSVAGKTYYALADSVANAATNPLRNSGQSWIEIALNSAGAFPVGLATGSQLAGAICSTDTGIEWRNHGGFVWTTHASPPGTRQEGRACCWTGTAFLDISSDAGDLCVSRATTASGAWTVVATVTGLSAVTAWSVAVGATSTAAAVVVAYKDGSDPDLHYSENDGLTWTPVTLPAAMVSITGLAYHDGTWVAVSLFAPYAWSSSDLLTWTPLPIPAGESITQLRGVLCAGGAWLLTSREGCLQGAPAIDPATGAWSADTAPSALANAGWLRGKKISLTAPTDGQVYAYDAGSGTFVPTTPSTGAAYTVSTKTTTYTAAAGDVLLCDASGGAFTVTLPAAATVSGSSISVKKSDASANAVTVDGAAAETIDGAATLALSTQYEAVTLWSDGTNWWVF